MVPAYDEIIPFFMPRRQYAGWERVFVRFFVPRPHRTDHTGIHFRVRGDNDGNGGKQAYLGSGLFGGISMLFTVFLCCHLGSMRQS
jgi:hypothetical protein